MRLGFVVEITTACRSFATSLQPCGTTQRGLGLCAFADATEVPDRAATTASSAIVQRLVGTPVKRLANPEVSARRERVHPETSARALGPTDDALLLLDQRKSRTVGLSQAQ